MSADVTFAPFPPVLLCMGPLRRKMTDDEFFEFCQANRNVRIERTSEGDVLMMSPTGGNTGRRSIRLARRLEEWSETDGSGVAFDSSTGFTLPNGAVRVPDAAWVTRTRWNAVPEEEQERFAPLCPDFVVELRSPSDRLDDLKAKMEEYAANGARLGWLIDPLDKKVYVYRPDEAAACLDDPQTVSGEPVLPSFELRVQEIWG